MQSELSYKSPVERKARLEKADISGAFILPALFFLFGIRLGVYSSKKTENEVHGVDFEVR